MNFQSLVPEGRMLVQLCSHVLQEEELFAFDPPQPDENFTLATPETSKRK